MPCQRMMRISHSMQSDCKSTDVFIDFKDGIVKWREVDPRFTNRRVSMASVSVDVLTVFASFGSDPSA